jgi:hypothetical protein
VLQSPRVSGMIGVGGNSPHFRTVLCCVCDPNLLILVLGFSPSWMGAYVHMVSYWRGKRKDKNLQLKHA